MVKKKKRVIRKAPAEEELTLGPLMSKGWEIYKNNFKIFLLIILVVYVPVNLILNILPETVQPTFESIRFEVYASQILELILGIIATLAIAYAVNKIINKKTPQVWESIKNALLVWDKAIFTTFLAGIILIALFLLLIIPGVIYSVYYTFFLYAIILNNVKYKNALDFSKNLVVGRWWRVFGVVLVVSILISIAASFIIIPFSFSSSYLVNVIGDTIFDIVFALRDVIMVVFFLNLCSVKKSIF
ncbi:hypothetical protein KY312_04145 [Candidatus Woesearchaeota archaeon]|nr:hypothetical protein [Candidatus Woesearchaeota archaeon]